MSKQLWLKQYTPLNLFFMVLACIFFASSAQAATKLGYAANAYGSYIKIGSTVKSGASSVSALGCTSQPGDSNSNTAAAINVPVAASIGNVSTNSSALNITNGTAARSTATISSVNLLSGLIVANTVNAVATSQKVGTVFSSNSTGSSFSSLTVLGLPVSNSPAANTRINLPGIGYVVLNEQVKTIGNISSGLTVNMIHVVVTADNTLGIAKGSQIIVGHARSYLRDNVSGTLDGHAYGSSVNTSSSVLKSGRTALADLPCFGTGGTEKTNTLASVNVPGVLQSGTVLDTVNGKVTATTAFSESSSVIQGIDLASLVSVDAIQAKAKASLKGSTVTVIDNGSSFTNLSITGHPEITDAVAPNTKVTLDGLGTLWLHRIVKTGNSVEVRMLELVVSNTNALGLPVGSRIRVGVANASVTP